MKVVPSWGYVPSILLYNSLTCRSHALPTQGRRSWILAWTQHTIFDAQVVRILMQVSLYSLTSPLVAQYWLSAAHRSCSSTTASPLLLPCFSPLLLLPTTSLLPNSLSLDVLLLHAMYLLVISLAAIDWAHFLDMYACVIDIFIITLYHWTGDPNRIKTT